MRLIFFGSFFDVKSSFFFFFLDGKIGIARVLRIEAARKDITLAAFVVFSFSPMKQGIFFPAGELQAARLQLLTSRNVLKDFFFHL